MTKRYGVVIFAGLCLGLFVKLFCIDMLTVSGSSMIPTLTDGENVVVNKLAYGLVKPFGNSFFIQWSEPKSGHLVVFLHDNKMVVKRCAAISGERLDFSSDNDYNLILGTVKIIVSLSEIIYTPTVLSDSFSSKFQEIAKLRPFIKDTSDFPEGRFISL